MPLLLAHRPRCIVSSSSPLYLHQWSKISKRLLSQVQNFCLSLNQRCMCWSYPLPCRLYQAFVARPLLGPTAYNKWKEEIRANPPLTQSKSLGQPPTLLLASLWRWMLHIQMPHFCSSLSWPQHSNSKSYSFLFITADSTPSPASFLTFHFQIFSRALNPDTSCRWLPSYVLIPHLSS